MRAIYSMTLLAIFGASSALAASSATLVTAEGVVMANQGEEFLPVQAGMLLSSGDRVMVLDDSRAVVSFEGGCSVDVNPGDVITIPVQSPCGEESLTAADLSGPLGGELSTDEKVGLGVLALTASALTASCLTDNWPCEGNGSSDSISKDKFKHKYYDKHHTSDD